MGKQKPEFGRSTGPAPGLVAAALFFLLLAPGLLGAQTRTPMEELRPVLSTEDLRPGDRFQVSVTVPIRDLAGFRVLAPAWPQGITLLSGPEISLVENPAFPGSTEAILVTWYFRADSAGWYRIPRFEIVAGLESWPLTEFAIPVKLPGPAGKVPPRLAWKLERTGLVQGQSVAVILELSDMLEYLPPESLSVDPPSGAVLAEVSGLGSVSTQVVGNRVFQSYPVASYILTVGTPGQLVLPPAVVQVYGSRVTSPQLQIQVDTAPSALAAGSGAVGEFQITGSLSSQSVRVGEIVRFMLRVDGEGNLNYLAVPEPVVVGGRISSTTENYRFTPVERGYRGYREFVYRIVAEREGSLSIRVPLFRWYNPERQALGSAPAQNFVVAVEPALVNPNSGRASLTPIEAGRIASYDMLNLYSRVESYFLILPPAFVGFGILLSRRGGRPQRGGRKPGAAVLLVLLVLPVVVSSIAMSSPPAYAEAQRKRMDQLGLAQAAFDRGDANLAIEIYNSLIAEAGTSNPALFYNRGIFKASLEKQPEAVFDLRRAARILPEDELFRSSLEILEQSLELTRQFPISPIPRGDVFFLLALGTLILFLLFLPFWVRDVGAAKVVVLTVLGLVFLASSAGLGVYVESRHKAEAVVSAESGAGEVLKIPENNASVWLELPAGTTVLLKDRSGAFVLVQTSYGIEGWVRHEGLIKPEEG